MILSSHPTSRTNETHPANYEIQTQLAELQACIQKYEQGEIERTVASKNIVKSLGGENKSLKRIHCSKIRHPT